MKRFWLKLLVPMASVFVLSTAAPPAFGAGPLVHLTGLVTLSGLPVSTATVSASAWPNSTTLAAVPAGQSVNVVDLGFVSVDSQGEFAIDVDLSTLDSTYVADDGHVEVELSAIGHGSVSDYSTSEPMANEAGSFAVPPIDLAVGGAYMPGPNATAGSQPERTCLSHWLTQNGPYQAKIMDVLAKGNVSGTGTYSYGGSTSTTLGIEAQSLSGTWYLSGSTVIATSSTNGFRAATIKDKRLYAQFMYRKFIDPYCQTLNKPYSYFGRGNTTSISHPNYSSCGGNYFAGDSSTHTSNSNQTYSSGLTIFGVGLTSRAGYSSTASLTFTFTARGNVCGNNALLGEASPIVEASTQ